MDSPNLGIIWVGMERGVIRVLVVQVRDLKENCCHFHGCPTPLWGRLPSPQPPPHTRTQLLSFLFTELFFLILIPGGFKAKITIKGKRKS